MTGFATSEGKQVALTAIGAASTHVGLALSLPASGPLNLVTINEVATPGYARMPVTWGTVPDTEPVQLKNSVEATTGPVTQDMPQALYGFLTDAATGSSISTVHGLTLGAAASGGALEAGTFYWTVTAVNANGETPIPPTITGDPTSIPYVSNTVLAGQEQPLTWTAVSGATAYNVYRGTDPTSFNTFVGTTSSTSFTDTNSSPVTGTPPSVSSATVGKIYYVWNLNEPVQALNGKPIIVPVNGLIVQ